MFPSDGNPAIEATCTKMTLRFYLSLDTREHASAAAMFAPDGTWHRQGVLLTGPADVLAALEKRSPDRSTAHVLTNVWAEALDPDRARVHYYVSVREKIAKPGEPVLIRAGGVQFSTDHYVRLADAWRIQSKRSQPVIPAAETEKS
jgi:hypothetical protein